MKLRWLVKRNEVTHDLVQRYASAHALPMMEAKHELINETQPVLQYWTLKNGWQDIPTVIITHEIE
jgi:hypothetical protein